MKIQNNRIPAMAGALFLALQSCGSIDVSTPATSSTNTNTSGTGSSGSSLVQFTNGQAASVVIGQPDFTSNNYNGVATPGMAGNIWGNPVVYQGKLYIPSNDLHRVLGFNSIPTTNGASGDFAIGQPDVNTTTSGLSNTELYGPSSVSIAGGKMAVTDYLNKRILIYNTIPTASHPTADVVIGQPNFTDNTSRCTSSGVKSPESVFLGGGKLLVVDSSGHRVLVYNTVPTVSGAAADLVIGQANFTSCNFNRGGAATAATLNFPEDAWTDGTRLVISDSMNNRILIWNTFPTSNGQAADLVIGQPDFTSTSTDAGGSVSDKGLNYPAFFHISGSQLFLTDCSNNRVLIWNSIPTANFVAADTVLGQPDMTSNTGGLLTASSIAGCSGGITLSGKKLIVGDVSGFRHLIYQGQ